ncbi:hypothetical protein [Nocardioides sp. zg-DK7169]|uniref:hypothetical protein n=1 Tax=Nocardioides sp. zg-DK7169 TaxID=2736600 RepID=UPI001555C858|nr:hypothetical protein [Nocardioides sp. zg-DK7169]NPC96869.1 hypothetical protein [Nocardioides sp. zg-DK7169]
MSAPSRRVPLVLLALAVLAAGLPALLPAAGSVARTASASAAPVASVRDTPTASWGVNGPVYATAVAGNVVVVGGSFSAAMGPTGARVPRANLAAFSLRTGRLLTGWHADTSGPVRALATDGTSLWVGGQFTRVRGVARARLAKLWALWGAVDTSFRANASGGAVLALEHSGRALFVGGDFSSVAGTARARLARVRARTGAVDTGFRPAVNGRVHGVAVTGSRAYLAGDFTTVGGATRRGVGAVARSTGALSGPAYASSVSPSLGVDVSDDGRRVFVAAGEYANALVAWDAASGTRLFRHTAMGDVQAVDVEGDRVYFGFHEGFGGDTRLKLLSADAVTGELDASFSPSVDGFWGVRTITATPDALVVGGEFSRVAGVTARGWARFGR